MLKWYNYWLCSIPGVGNRSIEKLLAAFGDAKGVYEASEEQLKRIVKTAQLEELNKLRREWDLEKEYNKLEQQGITFLTIEETGYPGRLKEIPDAPYGIFYKGRLPEDASPSVAIIGARDCSEYGRYVAQELGCFLGQNGVQIISGMARGIDGISQEAALRGGGRTTAVLGCGVDICYPTQNRKLYEGILQNGCILSTFPPGTQPRPQNFPQRNRIVSGLADAVVVIEARNKSGTLITVDMALEQGREVYVVPGRITDRLSDGCNRLLKQGAGILLSPVEFLEEIGMLWSGRQGKQMQEDATKTSGATKTKEAMKMEEVASFGLSDDLKKIYALLDFTPKTAEDILKKLRTYKSISEVNTRLMRLCLMGLVSQESPGYFCRKR